MVQAAFWGRLKISAYQFLVSIRLVELRGGTVQQRLFVIFIIIINIKRKQQYAVFSTIAEQPFLVALLQCGYQGGFVFGAFLLIDVVII